MASRSSILVGQWMRVPSASSSIAPRNYILGSSFLRDGVTGSTRQFSKQCTSSPVDGFSLRDIRTRTVSTILQRYNIRPFSTDKATPSESSSAPPECFKKLEERINEHEEKLKFLRADLESMKANTRTTDEKLDKFKEESTATYTKMEKETEEIKKKKGGMLAMIQEYGVAFGILYFFLWLIPILIFYSILSLGFIGWEDAKDGLKGLGLGQYFDLDGINPKYGNLAIAVFLNEFVELVRVPIVLASVKPFAKFLRARFPNSKFI